MMAQPRPAAPKPFERRKHQRVKVSILGRYMLSNRREYPLRRPVRGGRSAFQSQALPAVALIGGALLGTAPGLAETPRIARQMT
jgi:hypothetical protein